MKQVEALYIKIDVQQQGRMRDWLSRNSLRKEEASKRFAPRFSVLLLHCKYRKLFTNRIHVERRAWLTRDRSPGTKESGTPCTETTTCPCWYM